MTSQDSLKTEVRSRMERTGEKYIVALETVKASRHPSIKGMMHGNGSLDGAVLRSYLPLAELLNPEWLIANTGPGWNQIIYMPNGDWDAISIYGGAVAHEGDETDGDDPLTGMDLIPFDDVMELSSEVPLDKCAFFYVSEGRDVRGNRTHRFPDGQPPHGARERDELTGSSAVIILNEGDGFVKSIAVTLNWISAEAKTA